MNERKSHLAFTHHPRDWRENLYVYPVLSRRSGGISIGVNLNPDKACNFDCIYCQVDRTIRPKVRKVDLAVLAGELDDMLARAKDGRLLAETFPERGPESYRRINDIAFSGDGEPTTCPQFLEAVEIAAEAKRRHDLPEVKIVLITDACYLTKPKVKEALAVMDANGGQVWAKLDAGTEAYYQQVNRPNYPLQHVLDNILDAARGRAVVIQSLWMRVEGERPSDAEVGAFCDRLTEMQAAGGRFELVQVYTIARRPAEAFVGPLSQGEVDAIAETVRERTGVATEVYYGAGD